MKKIGILITLMLSMITCREPFDAILTPLQTEFLVVEGNIVDGDSTVVRLTRSSPLADRILLPVSGALLRIQGDDNSLVHLVESDSGVYKSPALELNANTNYRLLITTSDLNEYESAFNSVLDGPPISLTWQRNNGVEIFVNSSGTVDGPRYYKWDYEEVWEFTSRFQSYAYFTYEVAPNGRRVPKCVDITRAGVTINTCADLWDYTNWTYNDSLYRCWKQRNSTDIHVGSTVALADNVVYESVRTIPENTWEMSRLYSILVKQTALSKEGYEFYKLLERNSENLGSIFDAQPSELRSNIMSVRDNAPPVIGYVDVTSVRTSRLFIHVDELPGWAYNEKHCRDTLKGFNNEDLVRGYVLNGLLPVKVLGHGHPPAYRIDSFTLAPAECVDCRLRGVPTKPEYWPR